MEKVTIYFHGEDAHALKSLAEREYRTKEAQALVIIRRELERQGFLETLPSVKERRQRETLLTPSKRAERPY